MLAGAPRLREDRLAPAVAAASTPPALDLEEPPGANRAAFDPYAAVLAGLAMSPDGRWLALRTASSARLLELESGREIHAWPLPKPAFQSHFSQCGAASPVPAGGPYSEENSQALVVRGATDGVLCVAFTPDGSQLVAGGLDGGDPHLEDHALGRGSPGARAPARMGGPAY